jgi:hypothetical protein
MYKENRALLDSSAECAAAAIAHLQTALNSFEEAQKGWQQAVSDDQLPNEAPKITADASFAEKVRGCTTSVTGAAALVTYYATTRYAVNDEPEPTTPPSYTPARTQERSRNVFGRIKDRLGVGGLPEEPTGRPHLDPGYVALDALVQQQRIEAWKNGEPITSAHQPVASISLSQSDREQLQAYIDQHPQSQLLSCTGGVLHPGYDSKKIGPMDPGVQAILRNTAVAMQNNVRYDIDRAGEQFDPRRSSVAIRVGSYQQDPDASYAHTDALGDTDAEDIRWGMTLIGPPTEFLQGQVHRRQFNDSGAMHPTTQSQTWVTYDQQQSVRFDALTGHRAPKLSKSVHRVFMSISHRLRRR